MARIGHSVSSGFLVDTHCHLYTPPLATDPAAVLARAAGRGVTRITIPAYDIPSWRDTAALATTPGLFAAYGLHPWLAHDLDNQAALAAGEAPQGPPGGAGAPADALAALRAALAAQLDAHPATAVGEIGLDTKIETSGLDQQLPLLRMQLELAVDHDLPVILHCRGSFAELLLEVNRFGGRLRGVLHAFSRGPELGRDFIGACLHLGLGGAVTRDRARRVRRAVAQLPLDRFVLETDAPSIGLEGVLPQDTEPRHVADIAAAVAALRSTTVEEIADATTANAVELFRLPDV